MTKTQLTLLKLKRGPAVGFVTKSGLVRPLGHVNTLPTAVQRRVKGHAHRPARGGEPT